MLNTNKPTRYYSKKQEDKGSKALGLTTTANSGATLFSKGDAKDEFILAEFKTMVRPQKQHTIKREWLNKLQEECLAMRRDFGVLLFDFGDGGERFAILRERDFKHLLDLYRKELEENG